MTADLDSVLQRFAASATSPSLPAASSIFGLLLLAMATAAAPDPGSISRRFHWERTQSTIALEKTEERVSEADILRALARVHDTILNQAVELAPDARALLYDHLWDLYA